MSIKYTIDGVEVIAEASDTILSSALRAGVEIPTLCFDKRTAIYGACGICLVEVEGVPKLLRACSAKPMEGYRFIGWEINGEAAHAEGASGSVVACSMEGTRPILLEVQALICQTNFGNPRRTATGTDYNRVNLLMAVLEKRAGMQIGDCDAYVNIAGGIRMNEPAIDLGIVLAIISSKLDKPIDEKTICFGEVGLSGEVRAVNMAEQRVLEAKKLGFEVCLIPEVCRTNLTQIKGIKLVGISTIKDALQYLK